MKLTTLKKLVLEKNLFEYLRLAKKTTSILQLSFATAANSCGLLANLTLRPRTLDEIGDSLALDPSLHAGLEAWLACGVEFGELKIKNGRYRLHGSLSKALADPRNQIAAAMSEESVRYHYDAVLNAPRRLR